MGVQKFVKLEVKNHQSHKQIKNEMRRKLEL